MKNHLNFLQHFFVIFFNAVLLLSCIGFETQETIEPPPGDSQVCSPEPCDTHPSPVGPQKLIMGSVSTRGIFDPSLTFDSQSEMLWMSYSAIDGTDHLNPKQNVVSTRLAWSSNNGESWNDFGDVVNRVINVTISPTGKPPVNGAWNSEVSRVIFDPYANPQYRWRMVWHHYLLAKTTDASQERRFEHGWIAYKSASEASGLATANEVKLFGAAGYSVANDVQGGVTGSPIGGAPQVKLNLMHSDLAGCVAFTEPGLLATTSHLFMTLGCAVSADVTKLILLKCEQPCSDYSGWAYVATLLGGEEAKKLGYIKLSASDLFEFSNSYYLIVSPVSNSPFPSAYHGCLIYQFSDIGSGNLQGDPTIVRSVYGTAERHNGACTYHQENLRGGILYSEVDFSLTDLFQVFKSNFAME